MLIQQIGIFCNINGFYTELDNSKDRHQQIKVLTEDDLQTYTIFDVALPLPGYDITYPENDVKEWYRKMLKEYDLELEMPKQRVK